MKQKDFVCLTFCCTQPPGRSAKESSLFYLRVLHCFPLQPEAQEQIFGPTHFPPFMHIGSQMPSVKKQKTKSKQEKKKNKNKCQTTKIRFSLCHANTLVVSYLSGISFRCIRQDNCIRYFSCTGHHFYREGDRQLKEQMAVMCEQYILNYYILHIASWACYLWSHKIEKCPIKIKDHNRKPLQLSFLNNKKQNSEPLAARKLTSLKHLSAGDSKVIPSAL